MTQLNRPTILALAGLAGELSFELYAWLVSPVLFGVALQPAKLVMALASIYAGLTIPYSVAFVLHVLIGSFGFAFFVYLVKRVSGLGYIASGAIAGVALWFIAQGFLAQMVGRSFMMGFGAYTQSSFIGHTGMTLVIAFVWRAVVALQTPQNATA